jgi:hypothetical protein
MGGDMEQDFQLVVKGKLVKTVTYSKNGYVVNHYAGTEILVDVDTNIACIDGDYTDLSTDEFIVVYEN